MGRLAAMAVAVAMGVLFLIASCAPDTTPDAVEVTVRRESCAITSYFDAATGCEFLRSGCGGITPRLDAVGRPMCRPFNPGAL